MTFLVSWALSKMLTLTKHVSNMPVFRQRPQLILAPGEVLVVVPGKLHHLQHRQRADATGHFTDSTTTHLHTQM